MPTNPAEILKRAEKAREHRRISELKDIIVDDGYWQETIIHTFKVLGAFEKLIQFLKVNFGIEEIMHYEELASFRIGLVLEKKVDKWITLVLEKEKNNFLGKEEAVLGNQLVMVIENAKLSQAMERFLSKHVSRREYLEEKEDRYNIYGGKQRFEMLLKYFNDIALNLSQKLIDEKSKSEPIKSITNTDERYILTQDFINLVLETDQTINNVLNKPVAYPEQDFFNSKTWDTEIKRKEIIEFIKSSQIGYLNREKIQGNEGEMIMQLAFIITLRTIANFVKEKAKKIFGTPRESLNDFFHFQKAYEDIIFLLNNKIKELDKRKLKMLIIDINAEELITKNDYKMVI
ncbi:MAG: hypothetical protein AAB873_02375 [Patescibacteria group bacterium]